VYERAPQFSLAVSTADYIEIAKRAEDHNISMGKALRYLIWRALRRPDMWLRPQHADETEIHDKYIALPITHTMRMRVACVAGVRKCSTRQALRFCLSLGFDVEDEQFEYVEDDFYANPVD
jgi:hypothetical protein